MEKRLIKNEAEWQGFCDFIDSQKPLYNPFSRWKPENYPAIAIWNQDENTYGMSYACGITGDYCYLSDFED